MKLTKDQAAELGHHALTGRHPVHTRILALPEAIRFAWRTGGKGRLTLMVIGVFYILSPVDVIPELFLGPFGLADDMGVAALIVTSLVKIADDYLDAGVVDEGDVIQATVIRLDEENLSQKA
jgi:uncharacterized membrane protein YkvA (DUF1232 family)